MAETLIKTFARNLRRFAEARGVSSSAVGLERASSAKGAKVGKSTIGRYLANDGNPGLDHIEALAKTVGAAPWQLLAPEVEPEDEPSPSLNAALACVAEAIRSADELTRIQAAPLLEKMALDPSKAPAIAEKLVVILSASSSAIAPPPSARSVKPPATSRPGGLPNPKVANG